MTADGLIDKLSSRYEKANPAMLADIRSVLSFATDEAIDTVFYAFKTEWRSNACPNSGWFAVKLKELGFTVKGAGRDKSRFISGAWICDKCQTKYSLQSQGCPKCGNAESSSIIDAAANGVIECKIDCWQCNVYKSKSHRYGPECDKWGSGDRSYPYCKDCLCRKCCVFQYNFKSGRYQESENGSVETEMTWINRK